MQYPKGSHQKGKEELRNGSNHVYWDCPNVNNSKSKNINSHIEPLNRQNYSYESSDISEF